MHGSHPDQSVERLKTCIADLKKLATGNKNSKIDRQSNKENEVSMY